MLDKQIYSGRGTNDRGRLDSFRLLHDNQNDFEDSLIKQLTEIIDSNEMNVTKLNDLN